MSDSPDLVLYHFAPSRSMIARWMLEEVGQPYELRVLDYKKGEQREPAYLAINPMGKVPTLVHKGAVITEAAAICCYLADAFPDAGLNVPIGDPRRGPYLRWLFFGPSCLEPAVIDSLHGHGEAKPEQLGWGTPERVLDVVADAVEPGPYLLGDQFTAADVVIGSGLRWGMWSKAIPERAAFTAYVARLSERPAQQRSMAADMKLAEEAAASKP